MRIAEKLGGRRKMRRTHHSSIAHSIWMARRWNFPAPVFIVFLCLFIFKKSHSIHLNSLRERLNFAVGCTLYLGRCCRFPFVVLAHYILLKILSAAGVHIFFGFDCFNFNINLGSTGILYFHHSEPRTLHVSVIWNSNFYKVKKGCPTIKTWWIQNLNFSAIFISFNCRTIETHSIPSEGGVAGCMVVASKWTNKENKSLPIDDKLSRSRLAYIRSSIFHGAFAQKKKKTEYDFSRIAVANMLHTTHTHTI